MSKSKWKQNGGSFNIDLRHPAVCLAGGSCEKEVFLLQWQKNAPPSADISAGEFLESWHNNALYRENKFNLPGVQRKRRAVRILYFHKACFPHSRHRLDKEHSCERLLFIPRSWAVLQRTHWSAVGSFIFGKFHNQRRVAIRELLHFIIMSSPSFSSRLMVSAGEFCDKKWRRHSRAVKLRGWCRHWWKSRTI